MCENVGIELMMGSLDGGKLEDDVSDDISLIELKDTDEASDEEAELVVKDEGDDCEEGGVTQLERSVNNKIVGIIGRWVLIAFFIRLTVNLILKNASHRPQ